ncbi:hypothetical protein HanIR_Chr12g0583361 [Helianthus annuus]|nr:hypothetical protein HanIR_Chr12g0583361 [Helianthus annuus]
MRKTVNDSKGLLLVNKVAERLASVAEHSWVRRSKTAIWWIILWMTGTSGLVARRMRVKSG